MNTKYIDLIDQTYHFPQDEFYLEEDRLLFHDIDLMEQRAIKVDLGLRNRNLRGHNEAKQKAAKPGCCLGNIRYGHLPSLALLTCSVNH